MINSLGPSIFDLKPINNPRGDLTRILLSHLRRRHRAITLELA